MADAHEDKSRQGAQAGLVGFTPPPAARTPRRSPQQSMPPTSTDAFATPSDSGQQGEDRPFAGDEPAIFGGVNPPPSIQAALPPDPTAGPDLVPEEAGDEESLGLFGDAWKAAGARIIRSSRILALGFVLSAIAATWGIVQAMPAEVYVYTRLRIKPVPSLSEEEAQALHAQVANMIRAYPARAAAKALLAKESPGTSPGFLATGLMFHEGGAITWVDQTTAELRINSTRPGDDAVRLAYAARGLMQILEEREKLLEEQNQKIANLEVHLKGLAEDQKELTRQSATRNERSDRSQTLEERIADTKAEIARERRVAELWPRGDGVDAEGVKILDNRPIRRRVIQGTWVALAAIFGGLIFANQLRHRREARQRREHRRELLQRQAKPKAS